MAAGGFENVGELLQGTIVSFIVDSIYIVWVPGEVRVVIALFLAASANENIQSWQPTGRVIVSSYTCCSYPKAAAELHRVVALAQVGVISRMLVLVKVKLEETAQATEL